MCKACAFSGVRGRHGDVAGSPVGSRETIRALAVVMGAYGLAASADPFGSVRISTPSGRFAAVRDLGEAWAAAETLLGRPIDPLDPRFADGFAALA